MNLYQINFEHYSQKDSKVGIITYLIADSDESVYEWLKSDPTLKNGETIFTLYEEEDYEGDEFEEEVSYRDSIIETKGCMYNDWFLDRYCTDLYYGATFYGWELIREKISEEQVKQLKEIGIVLEKIK